MQVFKIFLISDFLNIFIERNRLKIYRSREKVIYKK